MTFFLLMVTRIRDDPGNFPCRSSSELYGFILSRKESIICNHVTVKAKDKKLPLQILCIKQLRALRNSRSAAAAVFTAGEKRTEPAQLFFSLLCIVKLALRLHRHTKIAGAGENGNPLLFARFVLSSAAGVQTVLRITRCSPAHRTDAASVKAASLSFAVKQTVLCTAAISAAAARLFRFSNETVLKHLNKSNQLYIFCKYC